MNEIQDMSQHDHDSWWQAQDNDERWIREECKVIGRIETARRSQSGKTLGVKIGEQWYNTKLWELADAEGKTIVFEPSIGEKGAWINAYQFDDAGHGPAAKAVDQRLRSNGKAKEYSIVAQALTKASNCQTPAEAWDAYNYFLEKLGGTPAELDDEIPF